jgi:uncharacterized membrane protein
LWGRGRRSYAAAVESELTGIVQRNIRALVEARREVDRKRSRQDRVADAITAFTGSMLFVYLHAALFGGWILVNTGVLPLVEPFDPFPFVMLAMAASVEAIFLSTFVLISQNRMARLADERAELDLQVSLLAEHEVTRLLQMLEGVARKVGAAIPEGAEELKRDVQPERVLKAIQEAGGGEPAPAA